MRALLAPVSDLAARYAVAIVTISHLNKGGGNEAMGRITGSLAFVAAARAAFLIHKGSGGSNRRLFLPMKNNLGTDESSLGVSDCREGGGSWYSGADDRMGK